jgi:hypothetical protein
MRRRRERDFPRTRATRRQSRAIHARGVGGRLDSSRVSHLGIDVQSIRSEGEPLRPIERLAGSGHCAADAEASFSGSGSR